MRRDLWSGLHFGSVFAYHAVCHSYFMSNIQFRLRSSGPQQENGKMVTNRINANYVKNVETFAGCRSVLHGLQ